MPSLKQFPEANRVTIWCSIFSTHMNYPLRNKTVVVGGEGEGGGK